MMKFAYTILYVGDVKQTTDFYMRAFGFKAKFVHEDGDYAELDTGVTTLAFSSHKLIKSLGKDPQVVNAQKPSFELAFVTDDVAQAVEKAVAAGAVLIQPPHDVPWGQTIAYVSDLNGFLIELCTPVGASLNA